MQDFYHQQRSILSSFGAMVSHLVTSWDLGFGASPIEVSALFHEVAKRVQGL